MTLMTAPDLASPRFKANPHPFYARLRAESPVYRLTLVDRQVAWLVTRYDDVRTVLMDRRFAKDRLNAITPEQRARAPWVPGIFKPLTRNMLDLDPPDHTRLRALVHQAFTPRLVERLRDRIQTLCDRLLDRAQRGRTVDLVRQYALPLPVTVIAELLGIPRNDRTRFHRWSNRMVSVTSSRDALLAIPHVWLFIR